jgi:asparagine synthase (glutamine-hydrolysing)
MCGIAGAFSKHNIDKEAMQKATDTLLHRGPDASGYYLDRSGKVFLGHRRLSIIDLSETANQPMFSANGRYVMVYNGEIYNFNELRAKLPDHYWKTHSDTEVILELFAKYGTNSFAWLNGMFALSIFDQQTNRLFICRDQVGIKPIFYYWDETDFIFGSELKVIVEAKGKEKKLTINKTAIPHFLHLGFIPEPLTIFQKVYKFPSAHYSILDIASGKFELHKYWTAEKHFLNAPITSEKEAFTKYKGLLFDVVQSQMISDVPLGTFLSGGIDSSLVTSVASKIATQKVKTFSIGFHENKYDESPYAEAIAKHLDTDHQTFKVSVNDILELVPSLLDIYGEPFADSSAFPTMLVSRLAQKKVTVTLSGDGGDEIFQGYGMYTWAKRLQNPLLKTFHMPAYHITQMMGNRFKRGGALFNYPSSKRLHTHIFSQEQYFFSEKELNGLLINTSFDFTEINTLNTTGNNANPSELQAFWDFKNYLKDDLLVKVDRASMQYSLETRVPLLDQRIIEFGLNLDYDLKVDKEYGTKYLMKKVLYELVPREMFNRPKRGFAIPLKEWLQGPLQHMITDYLNDAVVKEYCIVQPENVKELLDNFNKGRDYLYNRIWLLIILHWWLKNNS